MPNFAVTGLGGIQDQQDYGCLSSHAKKKKQDTKTHTKQSKKQLFWAAVISTWKQEKSRQLHNIKKKHDGGGSFFFQIEKSLTIIAPPISPFHI